MLKSPDHVYVYLLIYEHQSDRDLAQTYHKTVWRFQNHTLAWFPWLYPHLCWRFLSSDHYPWRL